jgi:hypothetical protein
MALYRYPLEGTDTFGIIRTADGAYIPRDDRNLDWRDYQTWLAVPNTPDPPSSGTNTATDRGDITTSPDNTAWTIDAGAVTLAKQANIATARLMGRVTAGTGVQEVLTGTQATTLLDAFTSTLKGVAPASAGGTTNYLRADGTWAAPYSAGGTDVAVADGGTGASTLTGLLQGNGTSPITGIANSSTVGQALRVTGASTYAWGALDLANANAITGDLPYANLVPPSAASRLLGRGTTTGDWQEVTLGANLSYTGTALNTTGVALSSRLITSGGGLTGGGDLTADRTLAVGAGTGITVNADDVAVNVAANFVWTGTHTFSSATSTSGASLLCRGLVDGSNYSFMEYQYALYNPAAATQTKGTFSLGSDGTYTSAGALTAYTFYIWDTPAGTFRMTVDGLAGGVVTFPSNIASTSTTTGALVITGGVGVGGKLNVGGALNVGATGAGVTPFTAQGAAGLLAVDYTGTGHSYLDGPMFHLRGTVSGADYASFTPTTSNFLSATASSSTSTGALVITGGVGIGGSLYVGGGHVLGIGGNYLLPGRVITQSATATPAAASAVAALTMGSANVGIYWGTGGPGFTAPKGSLYIQTDAASATSRLWVNTNASTTWTAFNSLT